MQLNPDSFLVDYVIVSGEDVVELQGNVHRFLAAGWLPAGGFVSEGFFGLCQAMYRSKEPDKSRLTEFNRK